MHNRSEVRFFKDKKINLSVHRITSVLLDVECDQLTKHTHVSFMAYCTTQRVTSCDKQKSALLHSS